jgi:transposase|tara:strand:+ start:822 stop:1052 length:231 start_codon:yes stop_codon:yes gene_type:complete
MSKDINELLNKVVSHSGKWYENVSSEVQEFLDGIEELIKQGKQVNAVTIGDILEEQFDIKITAVTVRNWLRELKRK